VIECVHVGWEIPQVCVCRSQPAPIARHGTSSLHDSALQNSVDAPPFCCGQILLRAATATWCHRGFFRTSPRALSHNLSPRVVKISVRAILCNPTAAHHMVPGGAVLSIRHTNARVHDANRTHRVQPSSHFAWQQITNIAQAHRAQSSD
jgi:hypothetical protein